MKKDKLMITVVLAVAVVAAASVFCIGCGGGGSKPSELAGQWAHASGATQGKPEAIELFKDGTGTVDSGSNVTWKVENKRLVISSPLFAVSCDYKISGYELALAYDDGDSAIFVRKGKLEEFKAKQAAAEAAAKEAEIKRATVVAESFFAALSKGDWETVGKYSTPETIQYLMPLASKVQSMVAAYGKAKAVKGTIEGDKAVVVLEFENQKDEPDSVDLIKIDGKWKVHMQSSASGK